MQQSVQATGSGSLLGGIGEGAARFIGRGTSNTSSPFLMPDNNASTGRGKGGFGSYSLAESHDLGRHMQSDRSTAGVDTARRVANQNSGCGEAQNARAAEARQASSLAQSGSAAGAGSASGPVSEKLSGSIVQNLSGRTSLAARASYVNTHTPDNASLNKSGSNNGTGTASSTTDMLYRQDSLTSTQPPKSGADTQNATILRGGIFYCGNQGQQQGQDRHKSREETLLEAIDTGASGAARSGSSAEAAQQLQSARMEQVSSTIMEQLDKMRNEGCRSIKLSIDLPEGGTLDLQLRWQGRHVSAKFGTGAGRMRAEIENGWASLTRRAGISGIRLEAPQFNEEGDTAQPDIGQYA